MVQTKQYVANRKRFGKTLFIVVPRRPVWNETREWVDGDEYAKSRTFPNLGLAKAWAAKRVAELGQEWTAHITRGEWREDVFQDRTYGTVYDGEWREDSEWEMACGQDAGQVWWEEY